MIRNVFISVFLLCLAGGSLMAQAPSDSDAIKTVIEKLFLGMEKGDSAMVRQCFSNEVTTASLFWDKNNVPVLRQEYSIKSFLEAIGKPHPGTWYEEYWGLVVTIDGDFASATCDYAFYVDKTFSHCGIDAFHFHKTNNEWKIFHLADTRRKEGCKIPKAIQKKHL